MNATLEVYKKAIKAKFEEEKTGEFSDYFMNISPAKFKKLCALRLEMNLNIVDQEIFKKFFNFNDEENKIRQINRFDTDKFRPFQNFLIRNTDISQLESLNLIAVLVNFNPRPYLKFRTADFVNENLNNLENLSHLENKKNQSEVDITKINFNKEFIAFKRFQSKKMRYAFFIFLFFCSLYYSFKVINVPEKHCMIWKNNHYEAIDCRIIEQKSQLENNVISLEETVYKNQKKIEVSDTTTFFKNGKPCVWYGKSIKKKYEFFSYYGLHPETGKTLKPISEYIIKKYIHGISLKTKRPTSTFVVLQKRSK